jgi:NTE family protein
VKLRQSGIDYGLVTVSLTDLKPIEIFLEDIPEGELTTYLLASSYLPGFKVEQLGGKRFLDGGFYDNAPIQLMTQKGVKKMIVVRLNVVARTRMPKNKDLEIIEIIPSGDNGSLLDFSVETARENLLMGYYDTLRVFKQTEGFRYCITEVPDEESYLKRLMSIEPELIEAIADEMGLAKAYPTRVLFEGIIPELVKLYGCDESDRYRDIFLTVLEYYADICEINRYQIYTYNAFLEQLKSVDKAVFEKNFNIERIPKILRRAALVSNEMKKSLLIKIMLLFFS